MLIEHVYQLDAGNWLNSAVRRNVAPVVTGAGGVLTLLST